MPIKILDSQTAERIAAGEVIEDPASVVKELVENSLDAGANQIEISVTQGGKRQIKVTDNGSGIAPSELVPAFSRFATSKLSSLEDLEDITSLGFRGEALPSIAAVSRVTLTSRRKEDFSAMRLRLEGGAGGPPFEVGAPEGTEVVVEDLFYNTPGRLKFLRGAGREMARISSLITNLALAHPECAFTLVSEKRTVLRTTGDGSLLHAIGALYGNEAAAAMLPLRRRDPAGEILLSGFLSAPHFSRASRRWITIVVNGRVIRSPLLAGALERAYGGMLGRQRHPVAVLLLQVPPALLDINVHPAKSEIRFHRPELFNELVFRAARAVLHSPPGWEAGPSWNEEQQRGRKQEGRLQQELLLKPDQLPEAIRGEGPVPPAGDLPSPGEGWEAGRASRAASESGASYSAAEANRGCRLIGQFLYSYLVAQRGEELLLIDQHAAHERVLYHALLSSEPGQRSSQLTVPLNLELPPAWRERFTEIRPFLDEAGFKLEPFGDNSYILRAVPFSVREVGEAGIYALLEELLQEEPAPGEEEREQVLKTIACHRAVKARQPLARAEAEQLLQDWEKTPGAAFCPHGRPTVLRFHRRELDRGFQRKGGRR